MCTYTAEDFGGQVLIKLADDYSHIVVLGKKRKKKEEMKRFGRIRLMQNSYYACYGLIIVWPITYKICNNRVQEALEGLENINSRVIYNNDISVCRQEGQMGWRAHIYMGIR